MFRRNALTPTEAQRQNPRASVGSGQRAVARAVGRGHGGSMGRAAVGLILLVAAAASGAITAGPGFLRRNFSPVTYLKASNPRPDAKLGFGSALTGRTLVMSRDGNTLAVAAPDE